LRGKEFGRNTRRSSHDKGEEGEELTIVMRRGKDQDMSERKVSQENNGEGTILAGSIASECDGKGMGDRRQ
jgi:hypothetical protein